MGIKDLIVTPIFLLIFAFLVFLLRPYVTNYQTRKFFFPAFWIRCAGAIFLGLIYQFYYGGGDTFNYWTHGSQWIWKAFMEDPIVGFKLLFSQGGEFLSETYQYSQQIWYYQDPKSYIVVRVAAFFDLLTFGTYSSTALMFSLFSFSGTWALYSELQKKFESAKFLSYTVLFIPSVILWGSGILKDTLTLGALCWLTWALIIIIERGKRNLIYWLVAGLAAWFVMSIKVYILICYLPTVFIWIFWERIMAIRKKVLRLSIAPLLLLFMITIGYFTLLQISSIDESYSLENIAYKAMITSHDIRYGWGARFGEGSGYTLGFLDGTWQSMFQLMPNAINVSLFRPYLWEVENPLMLLSSIESLVVFFLSIYVFLIVRPYRYLYNEPLLIFCLVFSILFAFAVGVSTSNFGTLMRYKTPMLLFYLIFLSVLINPGKSHG